MLQRIWELWPKGPPYRERENRVWNQKKKKGFSLGRNTRRREQSVTAFERITKEKRAKGCHLWEDSQGGEQMIATFKKIVKEVRVKSCHLRGDSHGGESKRLLPSRR